MFGRSISRPAARLVGSRSHANQLWAVPSRPARRHYSSSGSSSSPTGPSTSAKSLAAAAVVAGGAYAAYALIWGPSGGGDGVVASRQHAVEPPSVKLTSVEDIAVASPVDILDLKAADAKIRQDTSSFVFRGKDGVQGRVDVARVSSNNPVEDNWAVGIGKSVGGNNFLFSGVYDGHAGWATSTILKGALIPYVSTSLAELPSSSGNDDIDDAIKKAFVALDDRIMDTAVAVVKAHNPGSPEAVAAIAPATAGSCALLAIYDPLTSVLRTAVTGDSRAVLGSWSSQPGKYVASALSLDQTGFNEVEVERIAAEHPGEKQDVLDPKSGRLLGMAVTRAFGDHRWKWPLDFLVHLQANFFDVGPRPKYKTPPYMTARPEITTRKIETEDFVILASDGLWDHMSNDTAVECVSRWLAAKRAGEAETVKEGRPLPPAGRSGWMTWPVTTDDFAIEDLDSAAVCLVKNAFGGNRRELFRGVMTAATPASRYARDDITVQVIFFKDPYSN